MTTQTNHQNSPRRYGLPVVIAVAVVSAALAGGGVTLLHRHGGDAHAHGPKQRYICPMCPGVVSENPEDECPICGMDLVPEEQVAAPPPATAAAKLAPAKPAAAGDAAQKYICPMHPNIVSDDPDDECPICGMDLVPATGAGAASAVPGLAAVEIDPARQQLIGLRTVKVERGPVGGSWRTNGKVAIDETRVQRVNLKVAGYVERVFVDFVGRPVKKGEPLFSLYSPELYAAQQEYLLALETHKRLGGLAGDGDALVQAARRKLQLWDVPAAELRRLEETGQPSRTLTFRSPVSGVVTQKDVVQGARLEAGAMPYEIVDLSSVWVLADVYENELRNVKVGMPAKLTLAAFPNREFPGKVVFLDPLLDPKTRTAKVRLTFANPDGDLRPEMFGEVVLKGATRDALRIPVDAVIDSGTTNVVFVALGGGKFEPREVKLGESDRTLIEVVDGVHEGEEVVTRANFLVDSESRLRASLAELTAAAEQPEAPAVPKRGRVLPGGATAGDEAPPAKGHDHGGHGSHR